MVSQWWLIPEHRVIDSSLTIGKAVMELLLKIQQQYSQTMHMDIQVSQNHWWIESLFSTKFPLHIKKKINWKSMCWSISGLFVLFYQCFVYSNANNDAEEDSCGARVTMGLCSQKFLWSQLKNFNWFVQSNKQSLLGRCWEQILRTDWTGHLREINMALTKPGLLRVLSPLVLASISHGHLVSLLSFESPSANFLCEGLDVLVSGVVRVVLTKLQ